MFTFILIMRTWENCNHFRLSMENISFLLELNKNLFQHHSSCHKMTTQLNGNE